MNQAKPFLKRKNDYEFSVTQLPLNITKIQSERTKKLTILQNKQYIDKKQFKMMTQYQLIYLALKEKTNNKLENSYIKQLFFQFKYLLALNHFDFFQLIYDLHINYKNSTTQQQKYKYSKLRLSLQSCLCNFSIKQFNSNITFDLCTQNNQQIYQTQKINCLSELANVVLQIFQKIVKALHTIQKDIIVLNWYLDTIKILDITFIYGHTQPQRVKNLIKKTFQLNQSTYLQDFKCYFTLIKQYISQDNECHECILTLLDKPINLSPQTNKNYHNQQKYNLKQLMKICSQVLKLIMSLISIFKFFPSQAKLIIFQDYKFVKILVKLMNKIVFNLVQTKTKRIWKISHKYQAKFQLIALLIKDKIVQMYKFIFLNLKYALQQCLDQMNHSQTFKRRQSILRKFYNKLIYQLIGKNASDNNKSKDVKRNKPNNSTQISQSKTKQVEQNVIAYCYGGILLNLVVKKQLLKSYPCSLSSPCLYTTSCQLYYCLSPTSCTFSTQLKLLSQLQSNQKHLIKAQKQFDQNCKKIQFNFKQIITFKQWKKRYYEQQFFIFKKKLEQSNKEYQDQPHYDQQIEYIVLNDQGEDFTIVDWQNPQFNPLKHKNIKSNLNDQLSDEEIDDSLLFQDQKYQQLSSMNKSSINKQNKSTNKHNKSTIQHNKSTIKHKLLTISDNISLQKPRNGLQKIFKPHQCLFKVKETMLKQQLQQMQLIKNLKWHQLSKIHNSSQSSITSHNNSLLLRMNNLQFSQIVENQSIESSRTQSFININTGSDHYQSFMNGYQYSGIQ